MGMLIEKYIGKTGRKLFLIFSWIFCCIVVCGISQIWLRAHSNAYTVTDAGVTEAGCYRNHQRCGRHDLHHVYGIRRLCSALSRKV